MRPTTDRHVNDTTPSDDKRLLPEPLDVLNFFQRADLADAPLVLRFSVSIVAHRMATKDGTTGPRGAGQKPPAAGCQPPTTAPTGSKQRRTIRDMVEAVLRERGRPMKATEIRDAVNQRYGETVNLGSLNSALAKFASNGDTVKRVSVGTYDLLHRGKTPE